MTKKESKEFVQFIWKQDQPRIDLSKELESYLSIKSGKGLLDVQEDVELSLPKIVKELEQIISNHEKEFTISRYTFCDYNSGVLIMNAYKVDKKQRKYIENKIKYREKIKDILKQITWRDFEYLSKSILELNSILHEVTITKAVHDNGIDFFGYYSFREEKRTRFLNDIKIRIVGQAKHSEKDVEVNHSKISSFGTEINRLRKKHPPEYFINLPDEFFDSQYPIIGIFLTNTDYLPKALDFAKDYGIIVWNGNQISEDLAEQSFLEKILSDNDELSLQKLKEVLEFSRRS